MNPTLNKYVVAHFDSRAGKLTQRIMLAYTIMEATQKYARQLGFTIGENEHPNAVLPDDWFTAIKVSAASKEPYSTNTM